MNNWRLYTEEQIKEIIKYCCSMQKAKDYNTASNFLIVEKPELEESCIKLLDELHNTEIELAEITIEDLHEHLQEWQKQK